MPTLLYTMFLGARPLQRCVMLAALVAIATLLFMAISLAISIASSPARTTPAVPPPDLLASVRAEIQSTTSATRDLAPRVDASNGLLTEIRDALTELKDQGRPRRAREISPASPQICLKVPNSPDTDVASLAAKATGRFTVGGGLTYQRALILDGFDATQVNALDDETASKVYDGWKSSHSSGPLRWQCSGGSCRLVR